MASRGRLTQTVSARTAHRVMVSRGVLVVPCRASSSHESSGAPDVPIPNRPLRLDRGCSDSDLGLKIPNPFKTRQEYEEAAEMCYGPELWERVKAVNAFVRAHKKGLVTSDLLNEAAAALNGANLHDPQQ